MTPNADVESGFWPLTIRSAKDAARLYFDPVLRLAVQHSPQTEELYPEPDTEVGAPQRGVRKHSDELILVDGLTKVFHEDEMETHALSGISLAIRKGEFVAITGSSGSGKSTLLSILGLMDAPTSGSYILNNQHMESLDSTERSRIRLREIGFIFQSFNLIGELTALENVELPLTYRPELSAADRKRRVQESLERVGMAHRGGHFPSQLSGGQQQRVAIARALAGSPSLLLADEPTGNLDSKNGEAVMELLSELHREGLTIVLVTHNPRFALAAERIICLFDGQVAARVSERHQLRDRLHAYFR
jgi:putative ABC transport system ATP-binding protein